MEPTRFNGEEAARRWITNLRYTTVAGLENDIKQWIERVDTLLLGEAADWADTHSEIRAILAAPSEAGKQRYIELLKERFPGNAKPSLTLGELEEQLNTLKQYDTESLKDYYERARILLYELKINDRANAANINDSGLTPIESLMLSQVITKYVKGLQDSGLRYKVFTKYVDVNEHTKSLKGAYEASEQQLRVMKSKDLRQKKENERISQARNEDISNTMYEFMARGMSLEAAVNATAALFYETNTHEASMPIPNQYARTSDSTPRTPISASPSVSASYHSQYFSPPSPPDYTPYWRESTSTNDHIGCNSAKLQYNEDATENSEPIEEILASGPDRSMTATITTSTADVTASAAGEDYFVGEQVPPPCSMCYELPPLPTMDTESLAESHAITTPRRRTNLSPFSGLAIRSNSTSWTRTSRLPNAVINDSNTITTVQAAAARKADLLWKEADLSFNCIDDTEFHTSDTPDTDFYVREQVLSPCLIDDVIMTSGNTTVETTREDVMEPVMNTIRKPIMETRTYPIRKVIRFSATPCLWLWISTWILHITSLILTITTKLVLANRKGPIIGHYKGRPKVKIKSYIEAEMQHHGQVINEYMETTGLQHTAHHIHEAELFSMLFTMTSRLGSYRRQSSYP